MNKTLLFLAVWCCLALMGPWAMAGTGWEYTGTGINPPIGDDWNGEDVSVTAADANAVVYDVGDVQHGLGNNLKITSSGTGGASLTIGGNARASSSTLTPPNVARIDFTGDATLTGSQTGGVIGTAKLEIKSGKTVVVGGDATFGDYSALIVDGTGLAAGRYSIFQGKNLTLKGKDALVAVKKQGGILVTHNAAIEGGRFLVESEGVANFREGLIVTGADSILEMRGGGINLSEDPRKTDRRGVAVQLTDGGALHVDGIASIRDVDLGQGSIINSGGHFLVKSGAILTADSVDLSSGYSSGGTAHGTEILGTLHAKSLVARAGSTTRVDGTILSPFVDIAGGTVTVNAGGIVRSKEVKVSGGVVELSGTIERDGVNPSSLNISAGAVNVNNGGVVDTGAIEVSGANGVFRVGSGGVIADGVSLSATAGAVQLASGSVIAGGRSGAGLAHLAVSNESTLGLATEVLANSFTFSGTINLVTDGFLEIKGDATPNFVRNVQGRLNMMGGDILFHDDVRWSGVDRGIYGGSGGTVDLDSHSLAIDQFARIDASGGQVAIANAGDVTFNGRYFTGLDGGNLTHLAVTGMGANNATLTIGDKAEFYMSGDLQMHVNSNNLTAGDGYRILDTDAAQYAGVSGPIIILDESTGIFYTYEAKNMGSGFGVYVTGAQGRSRAEQRAGILAAWQRHPLLGKHVRNVLTEDYINAIIDGNAIRVGLEGNYSQLSGSGQFNARVLSSLLTQRYGGYDSLMLYNGSGLGMANRAVLNNNQQTQKRLTLRNTFVRREIALSDAICNPCNESEWEEPEAVFANRFWVTGNSTSDNSGHDDGFAGYEYRGKGLLLGYDRLFGSLAVGGAVSYMGGDFKDSSALSAGSTIDTYGFHLYGNYQSEPGIFVSGSIGYAYSDNKLRDYRILAGVGGWNTADFGGHSLMAALAVGTDLWMTDHFVLTPSVGFNYVHTRNASHQQFFEGAGGVGANTLRAGEVRNYSATIPVDLAASYTMYGTDESQFTVTGNVGYAYDMNNRGARGTISYAGLPGVGPVKIVSRQAGRHVLNLGVNAKYLFKQYELGFGYDYTGRTKYNSHSFLLSAGVVF